MRKKLLPLSILLLIVLSVLSVDMIGVSAVESPYIAVVPDTTLDLEPGMNFTVSIYTDYVGTDEYKDYIHLYQFALSYNPSVLKGVEVVNGDLIVGGSFRFIAGPFDNVAGELSLTVGYYDEPGEVTKGPGTLANVTFTVVDYGASNIAIDSHTKLKGWNWFVEPHDYDIINAAEQPDQIQDGYFLNIPEENVTHDIAVTNVTPSPTSVVVGEIVDITVVVENQGNINEAFNVTAYYDTTAIETKTVTNLGSHNATTSLTFAWDTTDAGAGTYTIKAIASTVPGETETGDNTNVDGTVTVIEPAYLPLAIITAEVTEGYVDETLAFTGEGSFDPDGGAIIAYDWDLGDETTGTGMVVIHEYNTTGIYTVTLVVTDSQNQVSYPAHLSVTIKEPLPPPAYAADLVKWKAKPEAHHWDESKDVATDDGLVTLTALAGNLGTEPVNVTVTFAILDAIGGVLAGPVIVEDATLNVTAQDPVSVLLDPYNYGYTGAKIVLYAYVTLKYDSDGDGTPDTIVCSHKIVRFSINP